MTTQDIEQNPALFHKKYRSAQHRITELRQKNEDLKRVISRLKIVLEGVSLRLAIYEERDGIKKTKGETLLTRNRIEHLLKFIEPYYPGVTYQSIIAKGRQGRLPEARHLVAYFLRHRFQYSLSDIGRAIGGRHHSTVYNSCQEIRALCKTDKQFRVKVSTIESQL